MNKQLLLDVVKTLESVPEKQFNINYWRVKTDCQTVACAIGWYCMKNPNIKLKLHKLIQGEPFTAIANYFDITYDNANYLFYTRRYRPNPTKSEVISRILKFVGEEPINLSEENKVSPAKKKNILLNV